MRRAKATVETEGSSVLPAASSFRKGWEGMKGGANRARSLSESTLSMPEGVSVPLVRQPRSFYNDRSRIYLDRSKALSEKRQSFQSKSLTFSERRRFQSDRTQQVVRRRDQLKSCQPSQAALQSNREAAVGRFRRVASEKYKKLLYGQQIVKVNRVLLEKGIKRSLSQKAGRKWASPFKGESQQQRLRGQPLVARKLQPLLPPGLPSQLKVLNLDRLFRLREGRLTNVVPLPVAKLSEVSSRQYLHRAVQQKDKIHQAIKQYNQLLRMSQIEKTQTRLAIKGSKFTKTPSIEQLMGLKLGPSKTLSRPSAPILDPQILLRHCSLFQQCVKDDVHLRRRVLAGLVQQETSGLTLSAFTLFWQLFVSRTARSQEKESFLLFFLLPQGQDRVELAVLRLILEVMCRELPPIEQLNLQTSEVLSRQEKSRIFLEALVRVLFGEVVAEGRGLSRTHLHQILNSNPDACQLLIRLLQKDSD